MTLTEMLKKATFYRVGLTNDLKLAVNTKSRYLTELELNGITLQYIINLLEKGKNKLTSDKGIVVKFEIIEKGE